jgi:hypothetical protein
VINNRKIKLKEKNKNVKGKKIIEILKEKNREIIFLNWNSKEK